MKNPAICPIRGALRMVMRVCRLAQPDNMPVACYRTKKTPLLFITGSRIATLLCEAVKKVRPSTLADDFNIYSTHSLCVWACVLLDKAGMSPSFIQKRLRWLEDSCKNVSPWHKSHPGQAPCCSSLGFRQRHGTYTHPSGRHCLFNSNYDQFKRPKQCCQRQPNGSLHWQNQLTDNNSIWTSMTHFSLHLYFPI